MFRRTVSRFSCITRQRKKDYLFYSEAEHCDNSVVVQELK